MFSSFCHNYENFVINKLLPRLEDNEKPYKTCIHMRDWLAGEWIPNNITQSFESSSRTLIVLSESFLESTWAIMRTAYYDKMLKKQMITILLEDITSVENLNSELNNYLKNHSYIKWGNSCFGKNFYTLLHLKQQYATTQ